MNHEDYYLNAESREDALYIKHNNLDQPGYTVMKGKTILQTRLMT